MKFENVKVYKYPKYNYEKDANVLGAKIVTEFYPHCTTRVINYENEAPPFAVPIILNEYEPADPLVKT